MRSSGIGLVFAAALVASLAGAASVGAADRYERAEPIVGLWERSDGRQTRVVALGDSRFSGQIVTQSHACFPPGTTVWRLQGSGSSYTGQTLYRSTGTCADTGWGASTWTLDGVDRLRHCGADPQGQDYGCVTYRRVQAADKQPPTVKALDVTGRTGRTVRLPYRISDDSGRAAATIRIFQGSNRIYGPRSVGMKDVSATATYSFAWTIPREGTGQFRFSVQGVDEAGNWSGQSFADITLAGGARVLCSGNGTVIAGTAGNDVLIGTPGVDTICGGPGNDVIDGLAGNDHLRGGEGNDVLSGGAGNDRITGEPGSDRLYGGRGDDTLEDHQPNSTDRDYVNGGLGHDYALTTAKFDRPTVSVEKKRVCGQVFAYGRPPDCVTFGK